VLGGFRALLDGHRQGAVVGDGFQMPGVFVGDTGGTIRLVHRHAHAGDNPDVGRLIDEIRKMDLGARAGMGIAADRPV
jgi:hypothetical protein